MPSYLDSQTPMIPEQAESFMTISSSGLWISGVYWTEWPLGDPLDPYLPLQPQQLCFFNILEMQVKILFEKRHLLLIILGTKISQFFQIPFYINILQLTFKIKIVPDCVTEIKYYKNPLLKKKCNIMTATQKSETFQMLYKQEVITGWKLQRQHHTLIQNSLHHINYLNKKIEHSRRSLQVTKIQLNWQQSNRS